MSTSIVPEAENLQLNPVPYAVEVFCDLGRGRQFITLHYTRESRDRAVALALPGDVLADLVRAGLSLAEPVQITVTVSRGDDPRFTCRLEAAVNTHATEAGRTFAAAMNARYGKP